MLRIFLPRSLCILTFVVAAISIPAPTAAQQTTGSPLAAYQAFLAALEEASSLTDLFPFIPSEAATELQALPEEEGPLILDFFRSEVAGGPSDEWDLAHEEVTGETAQLTIRAARVDADLAETLEIRPRLVREADGWKVDDASSWRRIAGLPASDGLDDEMRSLGPAVERSSSEGYVPGAYSPVAGIAASGGSGERSVIFDPRGQYVAVTKRNSAPGVRLLELDGLREVWAGVGGGRNVSFRFDGRAAALLPTLGASVPEVLPLSANLGQSPPSGGYFFSQPAFSRAASRIAGRPDWVSLAYHPSEPVLALGLGDHDDESTGAIAFQPTGEGLWLAEAEDPQAAWMTTGRPWTLTWAPGDDRLAWQVWGPDEDGADVRVREYPDGPEARTLSHPGFTHALGRLIFSSDASRLATVGMLEGDEGEQIEGAVVWDVTTGETVEVLPEVRDLAFAADGAHVFAAPSTGMAIEPGVADEILVWRLGEAAPTAALPAFSLLEEEDRIAWAVTGLALSPNGRFLVVISQHGDVELWDAEAGAPPTNPDGS